jgi:hypothetical protein
MVCRLHGSGISITDLMVFKRILLGSIHSISSHPWLSSIQLQFPLLQHFVWHLPLCQSCFWLQGCFLICAWMASLMLAFRVPNQVLMKVLLAALLKFFFTASNSLLTIASLCLALVILRFCATYPFYLISKQSKQNIKL